MLPAMSRNGVGAPCGAPSVKILLNVDVVDHPPDAFDIIGGRGDRVALSAARGMTRERDHAVVN